MPPNQVLNSSYANTNGPGIPADGKKPYVERFHPLVARKEYRRGQLCLDLEQVVNGWRVCMTVMIVAVPERG